MERWSWVIGRERWRVKGGGRENGEGVGEVLGNRDR